MRHFPQKIFFKNLKEKMMNEMNISPDKEEKPEKKSSAFSRFVKKHPLFTAILCGLIAVVLMYFVKDFESNLAKKALVEAASIELQDNNEALLKLVCKPLVWSVRSEMLRGNLEQVDLLITDLVKEKNFLYIHLIDPDGNVMLSTNKKMEGQPIDNGEIEEAMLADSTVVLNEADRVITVVAPVMGFDKRLSTLVLSYQPEEAFGTDFLKKKH